ncbi:MAG: glucose 1-dehydrogenase [Rhizobiales bacterium]|nr:glucose 1-dehydrogenase [Hyphomicrobiales bacterium]
MTFAAGSLAGRVALVTGAGAGIGAAIARRLADLGARIVVSDVDAGAGERTAAGISASGGEAEPHAADVTRAGDLASLLAAIEAGHGRLDILVNNAGLNVRGDFRHMADADWERIRATNLDGLVRLSRDAFPLLRKAAAGGGNAAIVNLSSIMASRATRQLAGYAATKGAVSALTRALAVEYAAFGIRVNYVAPGFIETRLTERFLKNPLLADALLRQTPLRRFGTPDDVADAVAFLASDAARFVTGTGIAIDGGMGAAL